MIVELVSLNRPKSRDAPCQQTDSVTWFYTFLTQSVGGRGMVIETSRKTSDR